MESDSSTHPHFRCHFVTETVLNFKHLRRLINETSSFDVHLLYYVFFTWLNGRKEHCNTKTFHYDNNALSNSYLAMYFITTLTINLVLECNLHLICIELVLTLKNIKMIAYVKDKAVP